MTEETIKKIDDFAIKEMVKVFKSVKDFNLSEDEYKQGYWMALNTLRKYLFKILK